MWFDETYMHKEAIDVLVESQWVNCDLLDLLNKIKDYSYSLIIRLNEDSKIAILNCCFTGRYTDVPKSDNIRMDFTFKATTIDLTTVGQKDRVVELHDGSFLVLMVYGENDVSVTFTCDHKDCSSGTNIRDTAETILEEIRLYLVDTVSP